MTLSNSPIDVDIAGYRSIDADDPNSAHSVPKFPMPPSPTNSNLKTLNNDGDNTALMSASQRKYLAQVSRSTFDLDLEALGNERVSTIVSVSAQWHVRFGCPFFVLFFLLLALLYHCVVNT